MPAKYQQPFIDRFWSKVERSDGCWNWKASLDRKGYGQVWCGGRKDGRLLRAHRVAWELINGPVPDGLQLCHTCDVRSCVNPAHLFIGTNDDNVRDMHAKGRNVDPPKQHGEDHPRSKFTSSDISYIRQQVAEGVTQRDLSRQFHVCFQTINHIITGRNWSTTR